MATTDAIFYFRPRAFTTTAPNRTTGASFVLSVRAVSGVFTSVGIDPALDLTNLRSFLPHSRQPLTNSDGTMNNAWYRFFQVFVDVFLGGAGRYTLADIISAVVTSQENTTALAATTAAVAQQTQANAEALAVAKQVIVDNALSGSEQIPDVQLSQGSNAL